MTRRTLPALTLAVLALSACAGGGISAERYLLPSPTRVTASPQSEPVRVALERVGLPGYLSEDRVASTADGTTVTLDEHARWAEDPRTAITRTLTASLARDEGLTVLSEPWPRRFDPDVRVRVTLDDFLRVGADRARLAGQFIVMEGGSEDVLAIEPFTLETTQSAADYAGFFEASAGLLGELGDRIRARIEEREEAGAD
ncbi:PqiC family protein [Parvularcula dongshanensis]|uniref:ABC-type transport auxiliary lipoprotein component domain-containing protein n=1 Tax=Parvularcula dongshanensis TaxID=1173995 RepID=A0A840I5H7_9PROT|nr:PqiC family protein [Parvularcula dongshanensis]MBB4659270.1 hypothetical protein [Parvularcula dongshanensis]